MKLMWKYLKRNKSLLICNILFTFGFISIILGLPTLFSIMINKGIMTNDFEVIRVQTIRMILLVSVGIIVELLLVFTSNKLSQEVIKNMRNDMFVKMQQYSHLEYEKVGISSLTTRLTNDAYQIMIYLNMLLRMGIVTPLMFLSSFILLVKTNLSLSYIVLISIPLIIISVGTIAIKTMPLSEAQQKYLDKLNMVLRENIIGSRVIKAFTSEKFMQNRFDKTNVKFTKVSKKYSYIMAMALPGFDMLFVCIMTPMIMVGAYRINEGLLEVGTLIAVLSYTYHALISFALFTMVFTLYPRAKISSDRINEVLTLRSSLQENEDGITTTENKGYIEFKNVTFDYSKQSESAVINNVSFTLNPGETVAIIGSTGSGKSTLIELLPRFYDIRKGEILVDGIDVRKYKIRSLREKFGVITQKAFLFSGSIRDNMLYANKNASEEDIMEALDIAKAKEFVNALPNGLDEVISEGATNLSGGQKQRLSIARAILKKPEFYIFDDSFSALDYKTDEQIRANIRKNIKNTSMIIVAQRIGTIMNVDKILIMDDGKIIDSGTHKSLMKSSETYKEMLRSQYIEEAVE